MIDPEPEPVESSGGWKIKLVKRFILANPGATIPEIVKATRTGTSTVTRARKDLMKAGLIGPAATGRPAILDAPESGGDLPPNVEDQIRRDIDDAIAKGRPPLTREERRQRLSAYADHPKVPTQAKIAALKELEATEPPEEKVLGPGAPLTREERVHRASLVLEALLDIDGMEAVNVAYERGTGRSVPVNVGIIHVPMHVSECPIVKGPDATVEIPAAPGNEPADPI